MRTVLALRALNLGDLLVAVRTPPAPAATPIRPCSASPSMTCWGVSRSWSAG